MCVDFIKKKMVKRRRIVLSFYTFFFFFFHVSVYEARIYKYIKTDQDIDAVYIYHKMRQRQILTMVTEITMIKSPSLMDTNDI
jgi:hypothetical protein